MIKVARKRIMQGAAIIPLVCIVFFGGPREAIPEIAGEVDCDAQENPIEVTCDPKPGRNCRTQIRKANRATGDWTQQYNTNAGKKKCGYHGDRSCLDGWDDKVVDPKACTDTYGVNP